MLRNISLVLLLVGAIGCSGNKDSDEGAVETLDADADTDADADADADADSDADADADSDADADADADADDTGSGDTGEADADADADADVDPDIVVNGHYEGTWEVELTPSIIWPTGDETELDEDTCTGTLIIDVDSAAEIQLLGIGECFVPEEGLVASLVGETGPFAGETTGELTGETTASGSVGIDLIGDEALTIDWTGTFGVDTFSGDVDGDVTVEDVEIDLAPIPISVRVVYEGSFSTVKVEVEVDDTGADTGSADTGVAGAGSG